MAVPAHEWKLVLTAECSNPNVIRRNGLSKMPKFRVDIRIVVCVVPSDTSSTVQSPMRLSNQRV